MKKEIESFFDIVQRYRVVFFDAYGVLRNFYGLLEGVSESLKRLKQLGVSYYVITNDASSSPYDLSLAYGDDEDQNLVEEENIISSGMLTRDFLMAKVPPGQVAYLGPAGSDYYLSTSYHSPIPMREVDDIEALRAIVLLDDEGFDWSASLNQIVNLVRNLNLPVLIANPDLSYPTGGKDIAVAVGALGTIVEIVSQKKMLRFGKPDTLMFSYALEKAQKKNAGLQKKDILMVGDTLSTDILGANKFGIDTALVLTGNTLKSNCQRMIDSSGIIPDYILPQIGIPSRSQHFDH